MAKVKLPSSSVLMTAFWVAVVLAAAKFLLGRFGGPVAHVSNYL